MSSSRRTEFDWTLILLYLLLALVGWLAIYTADFDPNNPEVFYQGRNYGRQFIWIGGGIFIALVIQILDTRFYTAFAYPIYAACMILLILTLFFGTEISGSKSWFKIGGFGLQTSEFAKFAACLGLAKYISVFNSNLSSFKEQIIAGIIIIIPAALILLQGDAGSAIVFAALILTLYREGLSGGFLLLGVLAVVLFVLSLLQPFNVVLGGLTLVIAALLLWRKDYTSIETAIISIIVLGVTIGMSYTEVDPLTVSFSALGSLLVLSGMVYMSRNTVGFADVCGFVLVVGIALCLNTFLSPVAVLVVFASLAAILLIIALSSKRLVFGLLTFLVCCSIYVKGVDYAFHNILQPHQQNRIGVILGTIEDKRGVGYNLNQSKIAIGSGGTWGKGFLEGTQNKGDFVPELSTDFIFCTIGEEFGFMGSLVVVGLFLALLIRITEIAERQQSRFSRVYAYGVASILFFHFSINIGMTIGLVPVIGIPLPFISYGGSSLWGFTILLFILVKLDSERFMYLR